jgi:hypothetical protein
MLQINNILATRKNIYIRFEVLTPVKTSSWSDSL